MRDLFRCNEAWYACARFLFLFAMSFVLFSKQVSLFFSESRVSTVNGHCLLDAQVKPLLALNMTETRGSGGILPPNFRQAPS